MKFRTLIALVATVSGCASAPPPRALGEAQSRVDSERAKRLEATRPRLVEEARQYTRAAERAYDEGDAEAAELNAQIAVQRFDTAEHLEAREVAETQQRAMAAAVDDITETVSTESRERDALARFREAETRFAAVEAELAQVRADDQSAMAQAQRAIVSARRKQAQAVGANAPNLVRTQYEQGVTLLDNALGALQAGLHVESKSLAEAAEAQFEQSIADAGTTGEGNAANAAKTAAAKAKAQAALDDALTARAAALSQRMKQRDPARFDQGEALLEVAKMRFASADYAPAEERAKAALDVYRGKSAVSSANGLIQDAEEARADAIGRGAEATPPFAQGETTLDMARGSLVDGDDERAGRLAKKAKLLFTKAGVGALVSPGVASPAGSAVASAATGSFQDALTRFSVEQALLQLRQDRADALSEGKQHSCPDAFNGFEAMLDLAVERFRADALTDAAELTARASERLRTCGRITPEFAAGQGKSVLDSKPTTKAPTESAADRKAREAAEAAIGLGQRLFVKARAAKTPEEKLEEPKLYLQEAQRWYERKSWKQARAMADEANKLLRGKPAPAAGPAPEALSKAEARDKQQAEAALGLAQRLMVKAKAAKADPALLEEPEVLLSEGQRWYEGGVWKQAEAMAQEATKLLRAARKAGPAPAAATPVAGAKGAALPDKAAGQGGVKRSLCPALDSRLSGARMARSMAGSRAKTPEQQAELQRLMRMQSAVEGLVQAGKCNEAAVFLTPVEGGFAALGQQSATEVKPEGVKAEGCPDIERRLEPMRVSQGVASAGVRTDKDREILARAVGYLERGRDQLSRGNCREAGALLDDAQKGFDWLAKKLGGAAPTARVGASGASPAALPAAAASSPGVPAARTGGPIPDTAWKPAYQAILDTLVLRDRANAAAKSDDERARLATAEGFMAKSRQAWDAKNYLASGRYAEAARSDYEAVLALADARMSGNDAKAKARAKAKIDAANQAKSAALANAEQVQAQVRSASAVLRDAEVLMARCEAKSCARGDAAGFAKAQGELQAARAAFESADYGATETSASGAAATLNGLLAKPSVFTIPAGVTRVARLGDALETEPRITFDSGKDTIVGNALASVDELARVLTENAPLLSRVDLVGFTDSQGGAKANEALSRQRAESLRRALLSRGVPSDLLYAEGRGEADPIASNKTAAGRERNRRVEVRLVLR